MATNMKGAIELEEVLGLFTKKKNKDPVAKCDVGNVKTRIWRNERRDGSTELRVKFYHHERSGDDTFSFPESQLENLLISVTKAERWFYERRLQGKSPTTPK